MDINGTSYDALDRDIADYNYEPGTDTIVARTHIFDSGAPGLLTAGVNPVGDNKSYTYDNANRLVSINITVPSGSTSTYTPGRSYSYDPSGRIATAGNAAFGTWILTYDANGRLVTSAEPATGGNGIPGLPYANSGSLTSPSTFSLNYYGDGENSGVGTTGAAAFNNQVSYRPDGLVSNAWYSVIGHNLSRTYTSAGRITSRTDPTAAESMSYDGYGRIASETFPSGRYSNYAYDAEDQPTGYTLSPTSWPYPDNAHLYYTATGELAFNEDASAFESTPLYFFDGVPIPVTDVSDPNGGPIVYQCPIVDARNLLVVGYVPEDANGTILSTVRGAFTYDAAGRIAGTSGLYVFYNGRQYYIRSKTLAQYQYDAEDHLTYTRDNGSGTFIEHYYSWGPNEHPVTAATRLNGTSGQWLYHALHWNGAFLSFTSRADGIVDDYKLGLDGDYLPQPDGNVPYGDSTTSGAWYYDRNMEHSIVALHSAYGYSGLSSDAGKYYFDASGANSSYQTFGPGSGPWPTFWDSSSGTMLTYTQADGITDGSAVIQGVRNYNPTTLQWTTPDMFAGDVSDPMGHSAYMWNRNNPIRYQDPTGFDPASMIERPALIGTDHLFIEITHKDGSKERISFGPTWRGLGALISTLDRKSQKFDEHWSGGKHGAFVSKLGDCSHSCQARMHSSANAIDAARNTYDLWFSNSNSANGVVCVAGFGATTCNSAHAKLPKNTPGYGSPILSNNNAEH